MPTDEPDPPSRRPLSGKVAVVTGASRGIGAATARRLAADGAAVVLAARSKAALEDVAAGIRRAGGTALVAATDLSRSADLERLTGETDAAFGRLDILVNNGGVLPKAQRSEHISRRDWEALLAVNLSAPWQLSCLAHDVMAPRGGGVIVNVTSTAASYPSVGLSHYCTSKAALTMVTRACALEWARDGIRVVGVAPGKVETELVRPIVEYAESRGHELNPQRRIAHPAEVAELIAYLVSDQAGYITGSVVTIDGGELTGLAG